MCVYLISSNGHCYHLPLQMKTTSFPYFRCYVSMFWRCLPSLSPLMYWKNVKRIAGQLYGILVRIRNTDSHSLQHCIWWLWSCVPSSSPLIYWKCIKMTVAKTISLVRGQLHLLRGRTALRLGVMMVFINEMLLMMAGDVDPNPGPGEGGERERERDQWQVHVLGKICINNMCMWHK